MTLREGKDYPSGIDLFTEGVKETSGSHVEIQDLFYVGNRVI